MTETISKSVSQLGNVLKYLEKENGVRYPIGVEVF